MPPSRRASTRKKTEVSLEQQPKRSAINKQAAKEQKKKASTPEGAKAITDADAAAVEAGDTQLTHDWQTEFAELLANASPELRQSCMAMKEVLENDDATIDDFRAAGSRLLDERLDEGRQHAMHNRGGDGSLTEAAAAAAHKNDAMLEKRAQDAAMAATLNMDDASDIRKDAAAARAREEAFAKQQEAETRKLEDLRKQIEKQKADAESAARALKVREKKFAEEQRKAKKASERADAACDLEDAEGRQNQTRGAKSAAEEAKRRMDDAEGLPSNDDDEPMGKTTGQKRKEPSSDEEEDLTDEQIAEAAAEAEEKEAKKKAARRLTHAKKQKAVASGYATWGLYCDMENGRAAKLEKELRETVEDLDTKDNLLGTNKHRLDDMKKQLEVANSKIEGDFDEKTAAELEETKAELEDVNEKWASKKREINWMKAYAKERSFWTGMHEYVCGKIKTRKDDMKKKHESELLAEE